MARARDARAPKSANQQLGSGGIGLGEGVDLQCMLGWDLRLAMRVHGRAMQLAASQQRRERGMRFVNLTPSRRASLARADASKGSSAPWTPSLDAEFGSASQADIFAQIEVPTLADAPGHDGRHPQPHSTLAHDRTSEGAETLPPPHAASEIPPRMQTPGGTGESSKRDRVDVDIDVDSDAAAAERDTQIDVDHIADVMVGDSGGDAASGAASPTSTATEILTAESPTEAIVAALQKMSAERIYLNKRQFLEVLSFFDVPTV